MTTVVGTLSRWCGPGVENSPLLPGTLVRVTGFRQARGGPAGAVPIGFGKIPAFDGWQDWPMDAFTEPDPAERSAFNRLFYRNRQPTWFGHWVSQFLCWWARLGLPPRSWVALEVRDRVSGRMRADAVVVPSVQGHRYIVSMFGTISDGVHNLEAAHGEAVIAHGGTQRVRLVAVAPEERALILQSTCVSLRAAVNISRCQSARRWPTSPPLPPITRCIGLRSRPPESA